MPDQNAETPLSGPGTIALGGYLFLVTALLAYATIRVWPSWGLAAQPQSTTQNAPSGTNEKDKPAAPQDQGKQQTKPAAQDQGTQQTKPAAPQDQGTQAGGNKEAQDTVTLFGVVLSREAQLILLVLVVGTLGGSIHAASSFVAFVGNQTMHASWVWYYLLRAPISAALALLAYFALRGGFFIPGTNSTATVNYFGIAALAGLVGMFSKQATDKLNEVFSTLLGTATKPPLGGQLTNKVPSLSAVNPATIPHGGGDTALTLTGDGFVEKSEVRWAGAALPTQFVKAGQLTATVPAAKLTAAGSFDVTIFNPAPGGGTSTAIKVTVT